MPLSAAKPFALFNASWKLTEPLLTGLMLLKSRLPELLGCGRGYPGIPVCDVPVGIGGYAMGGTPGWPACDGVDCGCCCEAAMNKLSASVVQWEIVRVHVIELVA